MRRAPTCDRPDARARLGSGAARPRLLGGVIAAAGLLAYHASFTAPFLFDDLPSILENPHLRHPGGLLAMLRTSLRPVTDLSFALNIRFGALDVRGYHAVNLAIHLLAGVTLFGVIRRTLALPRLPRATAGTWIAFTAALLWTLHPLQTESVTYIAQRAEALSGLCYLISLYALVRADAAPRSAPWVAAAALACAVGMGSKPTMVTAPIALLAYDRLFLAASWRELLRRRRRLYGWLALTWVGWALLVARLGQVQDPTAGFALRTITPAAYAATQPGVVLHYLRLAYWPHPLVFDYAWPPAGAPAAVLRPALILAAGLGWTGWLLRRGRPLGFLGLFFLLTIAPTSSVIPIADLAAEHRMYLPLAACMVFGVLAGWSLVRAAARRSGPLQRGLAAALIAAAAGSSLVLTLARNETYQSDLAMWADVVAKQPENPVGRINLGRALSDRDRFDEAIQQYEQAVRIEPGYLEAQNNWGIALLRQGDLDGAAARFRAALALRNTSEAAHYNLANIRARQGRLEEAAAHYSDALRANPALADAYNNRGNVRVLQGRLAEATRDYQDALRVAPGHAGARRNLRRLAIDQGPGDAP